VNSTAVTKSRLRSYFEKYSAKAIGIVALTQHFSDVKVANLNYHLKNLTDEGFLVKPKRGLYQKSPTYQSPEDKLRLVNEHIRQHGSPIQQGESWKPGDEPLKEVVNLAMLAYLGRMLGDSIIERMRLTGFVATDLRFVESLLQRVYPISEQQKVRCESALVAVGSTVPSLAASNGRSGSGSS
jgi:hypothetical protein